MKNKKPVIALIALIAVIAVFAGIWFATRPDANAGAKALTIEVVHGDGSSKAFDIRTDAEYLGEALTEHEEIGVVGETSTYGLYIKTVDGETASDDAHTYWSLMQNGAELMVGADQQVIADGETYLLKLATW